MILRLRILLSRLRHDGNALDDATAEEVLRVEAELERQLARIRSEDLLSGPVPSERDAAVELLAERRLLREDEAWALRRLGDPDVQPAELREAARIAARVVAGLAQRAFDVLLTLRVDATSAGSVGFGRGLVFAAPAGRLRLVPRLSVEEALAVRLDGWWHRVFGGLSGAVVVVPASAGAPPPARTSGGLPLVTVDVLEALLRTPRWTARRPPAWQPRWYLVLQLLTLVLLAVAAAAVAVWFADGVSPALLAAPPLAYVLWRTGRGAWAVLRRIAMASRPGPAEPWPLGVEPRGWGAQGYTDIAVACYVAGLTTVWILTELAGVDPRDVLLLRLLPLVAAIIVAQEVLQRASPARRAERAASRPGREA